MLRKHTALGIILAAAAVSLPGQSLVMSIPRQSQRATVSQRIALTDITVSYHRPLVGGREIWGRVAPYGEVWRAGANENTTIDMLPAEAGVPLIRRELTVGGTRG